MFNRPSIGADEEAAVLDVLRSGWLTTGPRTKALEERFARFRGCTNAVGVNSCTAALHLCLQSLGVGRGDEVITSPLTFASTANVIVHCGATPVFCDVSPDTLNMDPEALAAAVTARTRAIIPVHFAGHPCEMDEINAVAARHSIPVIEDAAHAVEAEYRGRPTGSLGTAAAFSFYATKNITSGEGGMLTTNDQELAERAALLALHGISRDAWKRYSEEGYRHWEIVAPGYKYNMYDLQAALLDVQLNRVDSFWERRRDLVEFYDEAFANVEELRPLARRASATKHAHHLYVVRVTEEAHPTRDAFLNAVQARGVGLGVHFRAVHLHEYYRETFGLSRGSYPVAEAAGDTVVSLPLYPDLRRDEAERVVRTCIAALKETP